MSSVRHLIVPLALLLLTLALTGWMLVRAAGAARRRATSCRGCGYDLRGSQGRGDCPECGRPFRRDGRGEIVG